MTKMIWTVDVEDGKHIVELEHGSFSGKRKILVDGKDIQLPKSQTYKLFDYGSKHNFHLSGHECAIKITTENGLSYFYELLVDGKLVDGITFSGSAQDVNDDIKNKRVAFSIMFAIVGITSIWYNWHLANTKGLYSELLAFISPPLIVVAIYYVIFNEDPTTIPHPIPLRLWILMVIALASGIINNFALANGLY